MKISLAAASLRSVLTFIYHDGQMISVILKTGVKYNNTPPSYFRWSPHLLLVFVDCIDDHNGDNRSSYGDGYTSHPAMITGEYLCSGVEIDPNGGI